MQNDRGFSTTIQYYQPNFIPTMMNSPIPFRFF